MLIDPSASRSYMANRLVDKMEWNKKSLTYPFITITPARDVYESMTWFKNIPINIGTRNPYANLISNEMSDYDAILGMH